MDRTEDLKEALEKANSLGQEALEETVAEANRRWEAEQPFSKAAQSDRWIGGWMMAEFECSKSVAMSHVKDWVRTGYVIQKWCKPLRNNGLKGHRDHVRDHAETMQKKTVGGVVSMVSVRDRDHD